MRTEDITIKAVSDAVIKIRTSKLPDPKDIPNAGSFFKNPTVPKEKFESLKEKYPDIVGYPSASPPAPLKRRAEFVKLAAGWLIEQCGWKGKRVGDAGVHAEQALVLVNYGSARGDEIFELSENIFQSVKERPGCAWHI